MKIDYKHIIDMAGNSICGEKKPIRMVGDTISIFKPMDCPNCLIFYNSMDGCEYPFADSVDIANRQIREENNG